MGRCSKCHVEGHNKASLLCRLFEPPESFVKAIIQYPIIDQEEDGDLNLKTSILAKLQDLTLKFELKRQIIYAS